MLGVGAVATMLLVAQGDVDDTVLKGVVILQLATLYGVIGAALWLQGYSARLVRHTPMHGVACDWLIDESGVTVSTPLSREHMDWRAVMRVVVEKDRILFAVSPALNRVLPLRCLKAGQAEALAELVSAMEASGRLGSGVDYAGSAFDKA